MKTFLILLGLTGCITVQPAPVSTAITSVSEHEGTLAKNLKVGDCFSSKDGKTGTVVSLKTYGKQVMFMNSRAKDLIYLPNDMLVFQIDCDILDPRKDQDTNSIEEKTDVEKN